MDYLGLMIMAFAGAVGFALGFLYGMDRGKKRFHAILKASVAEAKECRQMALNIAELARIEKAKRDARR